VRPRIVPCAMRQTRKRLDICWGYKTQLTRAARCARRFSRAQLLHKDALITAQRKDQLHNGHKSRTLMACRSPTASLGREESSDLPRSTSSFVTNRRHTRSLGTPDHPPAQAVASLTGSLPLGTPLLAPRWAHHPLCVCPIQQRTTQGCSNQTCNLKNHVTFKHFFSFDSVITAQVLAL
jgi:hypothetical protein